MLEVTEAFVPCVIPINKMLITAVVGKPRINPPSFPLTFSAITVEVTTQTIPIIRDKITLATKGSTEQL